MLVFLFLKYISDKYAGQPFAPITIPAGASFADMAALKGTKDIGDQINKAIIAPLAEANKALSLSDFPDFNDPNKLGSGKEMVDRLTNLIGIFEEPALDFSNNRAEGDDILGDAYEFLMRHFATESGKSKGQFYTPSEVSRIMAKVLDIGAAQTNASTTVYDPTCGSGSLLLKVADEAHSELTIYGQEKDATTSGLARMNMILHDNPTAEIAQGNTLADPKFLEGDSLKSFDYVVANPPFSDKRWSTGVHTSDDPHERFKHFGTPPDKQGDYAYLLHILRSLKSTGKGACILPHGVLFRGNAEAEIRKKLIRKGYLKAIIGLPANLFYGTGIPACILVLDKSEAHARKGIFMVDASNGFIKDGNKNRLRSRDIHQIVDAYSKGEKVDGYARSVSFEEIEKNDFNLNLPRYIDNRAAEDLQDIEAHLQGGIPLRDVDALQGYWDICPNLRKSVFEPLRKGYVALTADYAQLSTLNAQLTAHSDLVTFTERLEAHFTTWSSKQSAELKGLQQGFNPKGFIHDFSEDLLAHYQGQPLIDSYAVYQHLMDYWGEVLQDDTYLISVDGWKAETYRVIETVKSGKDKGQEKDKGWACDLVPKPLIVARYFAEEQTAIDTQKAEQETVSATKTELEEEHGGEEGALKDVSTKSDAQVAHTQAIVALWNEDNKPECTAYLSLIESSQEHASRLRELADHDDLTPLKNAKGNLTLKAIKDRLTDLPEGEEYDLLTGYIDTDKTQKAVAKEAKKQLAAIESVFVSRLDKEPLPENLRDLQTITHYLELLDKETTLKTAIKEAEAALDVLALEKYPQLSEAEIQTLVVDDKWLATLQQRTHSELDRITQGITRRVKELAERYQAPLPEMTEVANDLESKVSAHLKRMGLACN